MLHHFESCGHRCPTNTNPADFALDLITVDLQHAGREAASREMVKELLENFARNKCKTITDPQEPRQLSLPAELGRMKREMAPFRIAYSILLHRGTLNLRRQPHLVATRLVQVLGLAIVLTLFFGPLKDDYYSVQSRLGVVQQMTSLYFIGMLQNIAHYPNERDTFYKEHSDGTYSTTSFFLAYITLEIPFEIITSLLFAVFMIFAINLPHTVSLFCIISINTFCIVFTGESVGIIFNTLFSHTGFALNVTSTVISIGAAMAGILSTTMPTILERLNYLSPLRYMVRNFTPYSLKDIKFTCTDDQRLPDGQCMIVSGEQVLKLYGLDEDSPGLMLVGLAVAAVIYRILAYLVLRCKLKELSFFGRK